MRGSKLTRKSVLESILRSYPRGHGAPHPQTFFVLFLCSSISCSVTRLDREYHQSITCSNRVDRVAAKAARLCAKLSELCAEFVELCAEFVELSELCAKMVELCAELVELCGVHVVVEAPSTSGALRDINSSTGNGVTRIPCSRRS